jgi:hypothetical protein
MKRKLSDVESKTEIPALLYQIIANIPLILDFLDEKQEKFNGYTNNNNDNLRNLLKCDVYLTHCIVPRLTISASEPSISIKALKYVRNVCFEWQQTTCPQWVQSIANQILNIKILTCKQILFDLKLFTNLKEVCLNEHVICSNLSDNVQKIAYSKNTRSWFGEVWSSQECDILTKSLPIHLTSITFPNKFNFPIMENEYLTELDVGYHFNYPIPFFPNLKKLILGDTFNQHLILPTSLISLEFGKNFNFPIQIPPNLTHFIMGEAFNQVVALPISLQTFVMGDLFNQPINSLTNLQTLILGKTYTFSLDPLPISLRTLTISGQFNHVLGNLPKTLETLDIDGKFNHPIPVLPQNIRKLSLCGDFNEYLGMFPNSLKSLVLGNKFDQPLHTFPLNIKNVTIGNSFNRTIGPLPENLVKLRMGKLFNQPLGEISHCTNIQLFYEYSAQDFDYFENVFQYDDNHRDDDDLICFGKSYAIEDDEKAERERQEEWRRHDYEYSKKIINVSKENKI